MALTKISGNVIQQPFNIGSIDGLINTGISTFQGQVISTRANSTTTGGGQIYLNGATGNRIDFNTNGVAAPSFTTRSAGTKIVLYPAVGASAVDYAFGIENGTLWSSVESSAAQFKWYAGTTNIATLFGTGELVLGTTTKTGTADQDLQVTGGAYVSGSVGIGTTNPQTKLEINGVLGFTGSNVRIGDNTTGSSVIVGSANHNNFLGFNAGQNTTSGQNNNFLGYRAGVANTTGGDNNFFGYLAGTGNKSGTGNNFFGYLAGTGNTTGDYNTYIGGYAGSNNQTGSQNIVIGYNQQAPILNGSNQLVIGAGSTSWITGNSSYNVGIGTTNPSSKLHVYNGDLELTGGYNLTWGGTFSGGNPTIWGNASNKTIRFAPDGNTTGLVALLGASSSYILGNVGIGTTNPTSKLQVVGSTDLNKLNLSGISSSISSTAVDVFVYDTRKDSDGGAWRKRTQNTSWYNETLNTATRGSRKDFPAVAVIVATTTTVTIYDGDDPDMPMWMVFQSSGYGMSGVYMFNAGNIVNSSIYALNGILVGGQYQASDHYGSPIINFISEKVVRMDANTSEGGLWLGNIADRNSGKGYASQASTGQGYVIISSIINDVAMTVLPNAPIDAATGLPVPTIAVATQGGTSIIRDDGTVVSGGEDNASWRVGGLFFDNDNTIWATEGSDYSPGVQLMSQVPYSTVNSIGVGTLGYQLTTQLTTAYGRNTSWPYVLGPFGAYQSRHSSSKTEIYTSSLGGLTFIQDNSSNRANSMVAYATTSYNTGWMHGDIKGAWLSDTSTASVTGTELITNGTFTSGTTGWAAGPSGTISVTSGVLRVTNTATNGRAVSNTFATVVGQRYILTADGVTKTTTNYYMEVRGPEQSATWASGTGSLYFTAVGTTTYVELYAIGSGVTYSEYDNVSVRLTELDRSVNNKGLAVYGTITKTAVATGSNLVGYSGFTGSNYLLQPYNSALSVGTGDICFMGWTKTSISGNYEVLFDYGFGLTHEFRVYINTIGTGLLLQATNNAFASTYDTVSTTISGLTNWTHLTIIRKNLNNYQVYANGVLVQNSTLSYFTTFSNGPINFGNGVTGNVSNASMALWRISASAPSPTQIAKIYNDEKMLFQENSQATLYGASDAVTALAYDDTTKLLSVGTSSGRSDFQGLRRINNTTTAVTTAISASNGLIAEQ